MVNFSSGEQKETESQFIKIVKNFFNRVKPLQIKVIIAIEQKDFRVGIGIALASPTRIEQANARLKH